MMLLRAAVLVSAEFFQVGLSASVYAVSGQHSWLKFYLGIK